MVTFVPLTLGTLGTLNFRHLTSGPPVEDVQRQNL